MAATSSHLVGTNALCVTILEQCRITGATVRALCMHLHLLRVTKKQTVAPNHRFSCCERHEFEDFQAVRSARTHIQQGKPSHSTVARPSGQILYACLFTPRPKMTFAAAIIHCGTFYPGIVKVLHIEKEDLNRVQEPKESGYHGKQNRNG